MQAMCPWQRCDQALPHPCPTISNLALTFNASDFQAQQYISPKIRRCPSPSCSWSFLSPEPASSNVSARVGPGWTLAPPSRWCTLHTTRCTLPLIILDMRDSLFGCRFCLDPEISIRGRYDILDVCSELIISPCVRLGTSHFRTIPLREARCVARATEARSQLRRCCD